MWNRLMEWLDTSLAPVWIVLLVLIAWMILRFWRDMYVLRQSMKHDPPPYE